MKHLLLLIELYHIVPQGKNYLEYLNPTTDTLITTTAYTERLIDTFSVTKGDLLAGTEANAAYRDVSFTTDLRYRFGDTTKYGPLAKEFPWKYRNNGAIIFDVKVYWTGKEEPSVRSLMLRNPMAELMYGTSQESEDFRKEVLDSARLDLGDRRAAIVCAGNSIEECPLPRRSRTR